jgi:hypothetical protein
MRPTTGQINFHLDKTLSEYKMRMPLLPIFNRGIREFLSELVGFPENFQVYPFFIPCNPNVNDE